MHYVFGGALCKLSLYIHVHSRTRDSQSLSHAREGSFPARARASSIDDAQQPKGKQSGIAVLHRRGGDAGRVRWRAVSDTALVRAASEKNVAVHAPGRAPAVLDLPVLRASLGAHDDALLVGREDGLVSLDRDRKRADGEGSRHGCLALHVLVAANLGRVRVLGLGALACHAGARCVLVVLLEDRGVRLPPLEGVVHEAAVTALVAGLGGALHELLL